MPALASRAPTLLLPTLLAIQTQFLIPASRADCPDNRIYGCDHLAAPIQYPGASYNPQAFYPDPWTDGEPCETACYDLRTGVMISRGYSTPWEDDCIAQVNTADTYTVAGVPVGTPLTFNAILRVTGFQTGPGSLCASLSHIASAGECWTGSIDAAVILPVSVDGGESFTISASVGYFAPNVPEYGEAEATTRLRFAGLPGGAHVISCQLYDVPVATERTTWSRVRASYR